MPTPRFFNLPNYLDVKNPYIIELEHWTVSVLENKEILIEMKDKEMEMETVEIIPPWPGKQYVIETSFLDRIEYMPIDQDTSWKGWDEIERDDWMLLMGNTMSRDNEEMETTFQENGGNFKNTVGTLGPICTKNDQVNVRETSLTTNVKTRVSASVDPVADKVWKDANEYLNGYALQEEIVNVPVGVGFDKTTQNCRLGCPKQQFLYAISHLHSTCLQDALKGKVHTSFARSQWHAYQDCALGMMYKQPLAALEALGIDVQEERECIVMRFSDNTSGHLKVSELALLFSTNMMQPSLVAIQDDEGYPTRSFCYVVDFHALWHTTEQPRWKAMDPLNPLSVMATMQKGSAAKLLEYANINIRARSAAFNKESLVPHPYMHYIFYRHDFIHPTLTGVYYGRYASTLCATESGLVRDIRRRNPLMSHCAVSDNACVFLTLTDGNKRDKAVFRVKSVNLSRLSVVIDDDGRISFWVSNDARNAGVLFIHKIDHDTASFVIGTCNDRTCSISMKRRYIAMHLYLEDSVYFGSWILLHQEACGSVN